MHFEKLKQGQENLVKRWLQQDYVAEYWFGEGLKNTLQSIEKFITSQELLYTLWLAYDEKTPFAFLMTSEVGSDDEPFSKFCGPSTKAITLDLLIGDRAYLGRGLAHVMIGQFLQQKFHDKTDVFIDPSIKNTRAIHVYEKAGFEKLEEFIPSWCPDPHILMSLKMCGSDLR